VKLSRHSVSRPVFTTMVTLIVILIGVVAFFRLPIDLMPEITYPTVSIISNYENASAEEMEELITRPLEEAMSSVPGVEEVTSTSSEGRSRLRITFTWGTDLDAAANDIRDRLDRVIQRIPEDAERPTLRKFDLASFPVLILGASSNLDPVQMRRIIDDQIKYRIERIPGVASLDVFGGLNREIHVYLSADKIKALDLPMDMIIRRIRAENINLPSGTIDRGVYEVTIRTPGHYNDLEEIRNTIVAIREGVPVQLREIADVEDSWERITRIVRINGKPGVRLGVYKQSGTNTVEVARGALAEIERINRDIPQIHLIPMIDTSEYIQRSINNVGSMAFNSIVVLENIFRLRESRVPREEAAVEGSGEVTSAIIASTLTTLAVFLPLIFVRGMSGVMFKQLSLVVSFSLFCSLVVAVTLVPMLAAKMLKSVQHNPSPAHHTRVGKFFEFSKQIFAQIETRYKGYLHYALDHRPLVVGVTILIFLASLALIPLIGVEFMPKADEGEVRVNAEMDVGTRVEVLDEKFELIEKSVNESVPELENTVTSMGGGGWRARGSHTGEMRVALVPQKERSRSSEQIASLLREKLANIPGVIIRTREGQGLFLFRIVSGGTERVQVEVRGHDLETSDVLAKRGFPDRQYPSNSALRHSGRILPRGRRSIQDSRPGQGCR